MPDRENVVKGLECCRSRHLNLCNRCPYFESNTNPDDEDDDTCTNDLLDDALVLVKKQDPVRPKKESDGNPGRWASWWYVCGDCGGQIDYQDGFCRHCGRGINWNDRD